MRTPLLVSLGTTLAALLGAAPAALAQEEPTLTVSPAAPVGRVREVAIDLEPFTGEDRVRRIRYDLDAAEATLTVADHARMPTWIVASRIVLSEVGPGRLLHSSEGMTEAIAVLQTLRNRMDPTVWNPEGVRGVRPWPGCGEGATFHSCANPDQYRGLTQRLALSPRSTLRDTEVREHILDATVAAWWLVFHARIPDVTGGATSFLHRCGGAAYGRSRAFCDGDSETPDVPGATSSTGPAVFRGPGRFSASSGRYEMITTRMLDYVAQEEPVIAGIDPEGDAADDAEALAPPE